MAETTHGSDAEAPDIRSLRIWREMAQVRTCELSPFLTIHNNELVAYSRSGVTVVVGFPSRFPFVPPLAVLRENDEDEPCAAEAALRDAGLIGDQNVLLLDSTTEWLPSTRVVDVLSDVDGVVKAHVDVTDTEGSTQDDEDAVAVSRVVDQPSATYPLPGATREFEDLRGVVGGVAFAARRVQVRSGARTLCTLLLGPTFLAEAVPHPTVVGGVVNTFARPMSTLRRVALRARGLLLEMDYRPCAVRVVEQDGAVRRVVSLSGEACVYELEEGTSLLSQLTERMRAMGVPIRRLARGQDVATHEVPEKAPDEDDDVLVFGEVRRRSTIHLRVHKAAALRTLEAVQESMERAPSSMSEVLSVSDAFMKAVEACGALEGEDSECASMMSTLRAYLARDDVVAVMEQNSRQAGAESSRSPDAGEGRGASTEG